MIVADRIPEFRSVVYRSTFAYSAATDQVTFWFSGARVAGKHITWRTAVERRSRSALFGVTSFNVAKDIPVASRSVTSTFAPP